jgi:signal transduction histidine kinase
MLYDAASRQFYRHLLFVLVITGFAILAAFFLARSITGPMTELTGTARAFGSGDLTARTDISGIGAVRELGETFNQMAEQISEREERSKELDRLKSEFIGSVSHELRTPLTTIKTFVRVLQNNQISNNEREEYLQTIAVECDRQIDFVQNLLDLSRIEAGDFEPVFAETDVSNLLQDVVGSQLRTAESRQLDLRFEHGDDDQYRVSTDAALLRRVITSLIENAMKYTSEGGAIYLSIGRFSEWIWISVEDNGRGIHPEDLGHIFERFFRGRPIASPLETTEDNDGADVEANEASGIGLGLYLVKSMIDKINAQIIPESPANDIGTGTRFTILLPTRPESIE